jgi:hypothetical protein
MIQEPLEIAHEASVQVRDKLRQRRLYSEVCQRGTLANKCEFVQPSECEFVQPNVMVAEEPDFFSALSDDLLLLIFDKLFIWSLFDNVYVMRETFTHLTPFACISRRCASLARACGWERACRRAFPGLSHVFPELANQFDGETTATGAEVAWTALARVLSWFPGHGVTEGQPVFVLTGCDPKVLEAKTRGLWWFRMPSEWREGFAKGAAILAPSFCRGEAKSIHVFLRQRSYDIVGQDFFKNKLRTSDQWGHAIYGLTILWGFVAWSTKASKSRERVRAAVCKTDFVCPFCPSPMLQIPTEGLAKERTGSDPLFFICENGHLYGLACCRHIPRLHLR